MSDLAATAASYTHLVKVEGKDLYARRCGFKSWQPTHRTFDARLMTKEEADFWVEHFNRWFELKFVAIERP